MSFKVWLFYLLRSVLHPHRLIRLQASQSRNTLTIKNTLQKSQNGSLKITCHLFSYKKITAIFWSILQINHPRYKQQQKYEYLYKEIGVTYRLRAIDVNQYLQ